MVEIGGFFEGAKTTTGGTCPGCLEGADELCFNAKVSGSYTPGTFQEYVLAPPIM